jgi:hypothetical protein
LPEELARLTVEYPKKYETAFKIYLVKEGINQKEFFTNAVIEAVNTIVKEHPTLVNYTEKIPK